MTEKQKKAYLRILEKQRAARRALQGRAEGHSGVPVA